MIKIGSENYRVIDHLLFVGGLSAAQACQDGISNNLRSRVPQLQALGFDIIATTVEKKHYCIYSVPSHLIWKNKALFEQETKTKKIQKVEQVHKATRESA